MAGMRKLNCLGWFRGQTIGWVEPPSSVADSGVAADEEMGSVCGPPMTGIVFSTLAEKVLEPTRSIKNVILKIEGYRHAKSDPNELNRMIKANSSPTSPLTSLRIQIPLPMRMPTQERQAPYIPLQKRALLATQLQRHNPAHLHRHPHLLPTPHQLPRIQRLLPLALRPLALRFLPIRTDIAPLGIEDALEGLGVGQAVVRVLEAAVRGVVGLAGRAEPVVALPVLVRQGAFGEPDHAVYEPVVDLRGGLDVPGGGDGARVVEGGGEGDGDGRGALEVGAVHGCFDPVVVFGAEVGA